MAPGRDDPDRKLFADELRAMRQQRGWSREELGKMINFSASVISNMESMFRAPTRQQALLLDKAFGMPGTFGRLEERLRGLAFSSGFRPFWPYEEAAHTLRAFEPMLVPGLFQTEDYARAMFETDPEASEQVVQERIEGRMARQAILGRAEPAPPWMWVVLDEHVLHRNIGGPAVMCGQLEYLAELSTRQRISIQVIPADRPHPGLLGAFWIAELEQAPAVVYLETASEGETIETHYMAKSMSVLFDALRGEALSRSASRDMVEEAAQRWKGRSET